jgi:hypothetical protein
MTAIATWRPPRWLPPHPYVESAAAALGGQLTLQSLRPAVITGGPTWPNECNMDSPLHQLLPVTQARAHSGRRCDRRATNPHRRCAWLVTKGGPTPTVLELQPTPTNLPPPAV